MLQHCPNTFCVNLILTLRVIFQCQYHDYHQLIATAWLGFAYVETGVDVPLMAIRRILQEKRVFASNDIHEISKNLIKYSNP